jgi:non-heme chloroperoxidase
MSEQDAQVSWNIALGASATATRECVWAWLTDFRQDLPMINVPTLIVQGDQDRICPIHATGQRSPALINDARFVIVEGPTWPQLDPCRGGQTAHSSRFYTSNG